MFTNSDVVFILTFSVIMLNSDAHNNNIKKEDKMTLEEFLRNNRGIDDGKDLDPVSDCMIAIFVDNDDETVLVYC